MKAVSLVLVSFLALGGSAAGQSKCLQSGESGVGVSYSFATGDFSDAHNFALGYSIKGRLDLGLNHTRHGGNDGSATGYSLAAYPIKQGEFGIPVAVGVSGSYASESGFGAGAIGITVERMQAFGTTLFVMPEGFAGFYIPEDGSTKTMLAAGFSLGAAGGVVTPVLSAGYSAIRLEAGYPYDYLEQTSWWVSSWAYGIDVVFHWGATRR